MKLLAPVDDEDAQRKMRLAEILNSPAAIVYRMACRQK